MTNLDSIFKSRDIALPTKVRLVKAMVFPVVMYGCESWHPWDSPGKNTGVGCHFLLQCMKVKSEGEVTQSCPTLATAAYQAPLPMGFSRQKYWSGVPLPSPTGNAGYP